MYKVIFFDLGNVLLFFNHDRMCRQVAQFCALPEEIVRKALFKEGVARGYETGTLNSRDLHTFFSDLSGKTLDFKGLMHAVGDIFEPNLPLVPIIEQLKKKRLQLYILSNTNEAHFSFALSRFPFLKLFDGHVLSYEAKACKPDEKIYEFALKKASCSREQCFYTDDIDEFVQAARNIGIDAELYTTPAALKEQLKTRELL